jgi:hypothetical protein
VNSTLPQNPLASQVGPGGGAVRGQAVRLPVRAGSRREPASRAGAALGLDALGLDALGLDALGLDALGRGALGRGAAGRL